MASGPFEGPECRAFECLFPRSRSSFAVRAVLAQPSRTAVYGPVRTVVWQGSVGDRRPYADQDPYGDAVFRLHPSHNPFKIPTFWHDEIPIVFSAVDIVDSLWD